MTKLEFLGRLEAGLSQLPEGERRRQLEYFEEMLDDRIEDGMGEEEAVASLGDPARVAAEILQDMPLPKLMGTRMRPKDGWTGLSVVLLVLGFPVWFPIVVSILAVAFAVYLVVWSVMVALFAVVVSIGVAGIALIITLFLQFPPTVPLGILVLGAALLLAGLSVFAFYGVLLLGKGLVRLTALTVRRIKSWFIKKEDAR